MSSGESKSSAILIIAIGVLLIGALIGIFFPTNKTRNTDSGVIPAINQRGYIQGQDVNPNEGRETDAYYIKADIDKPVCGVKVFSPLPGQKVSFPLEVSGYVNGCNWTPFEGEALTLEVRDRNNALSKLIIVPVFEDDLTLPAYFKTKINIEAMPTTGDGVLIFHNRNISGEKDETFQVPIIF